MIGGHNKYLGSGQKDNILGCPGCGYHHPVLSDGLGGPFSPEVLSVAIVDRYPKKGLPPVGLPFSIEVEVNVDRTFGSQSWNWLTNPFSFGAAFACPDVVVAAKEAYKESPKVLAADTIITDSAKGCVGTVRLSFPATYRPGEKDWIVLEVYPDGTKKEEIQSGEVEPLLKSQPLQPAVSYEKGLQYGLYDQKTGIFGIPTGSLNPFSGAGSTIKSLTTLLAVGAGGYLVWKNGDTIKKFVSRKVNSVKPSTIKKKLSR